MCRPKFQTQDLCRCRAVHSRGYPLKCGADTGSLTPPVFKLGDIALASIIWVFKIYITRKKFPSALDLPAWSHLVILRRPAGTCSSSHIGCPPGAIHDGHFLESSNCGGLGDVKQKLGLTSGYFLPSSPNIPLSLSALDEVCLLVQPVAALASIISKCVTPESSNATSRSMSS